MGLILLLSWCTITNWYYPYHYAPMTSSLMNIDQYDIKFKNDVPVEPIVQFC